MRDIFFRFFFLSSKSKTSRKICYSVEVNPPLPQFNPSIGQHGGLRFHQPHNDGQPSLISCSCKNSK